MLLLIIDMINKKLNGNWNEVAISICNTWITNLDLILEQNIKEYRILNISHTIIYMEFANLTKFGL